MHACGTWFGCGSVNTVTEEFLDTRLYREAKGKEEGAAVEEEGLSSGECCWIPSSWGLCSLAGPKGTKLEQKRSRRGKDTVLALEAAVLVFHPCEFPVKFRAILLYSRHAAALSFSAGHPSTIFISEIMWKRSISSVILVPSTQLSAVHFWCLCACRHPPSRSSLALPLYHVSPWSCLALPTCCPSFQGTFLF